ncbi:hypothetical protein GCM10023324_68620 [Streptomyces youssoufiensis]
MTGSSTEAKFWQDKDGVWRVQWAPAGGGHDYYVLVQLDEDGHADFDDLDEISKACRVEDLQLRSHEAPPADRYAVVAVREKRPAVGARVRGIQHSSAATSTSLGKGNLASYLTGWKKWREIAPQKVAAKEKKGDLKRDSVDQWYRYTQTYLLTAKPPERVTMDSRGHIWPGAIVRGDDAVRGELSPVGIRPQKRAALTIAVNALGASKSETVEKPGSGNVLDAIKNAVDGKKCTSPTIVFHYTGAYEATQTALSLGVSAAYGRFGTDVKAKLSRSEKKNTAAVLLYEKAFTATAELDGNPNSLISDDCSDSDLQDVISNGGMGRDNPPLIISDVAYGRILFFTMTHHAEESDIEAAIKASYRGFKDLSSELEAHYKGIIKYSDIAIISHGGGLKELREFLENGEIGAFFKKGKMLTDYSIVGFSLKTLDGREALMSEEVTFDEVIWRNQEKADSTWQVTLSVGSVRFWGWLKCGSNVQIDGTWTGMVSNDHTATGKRAFNSEMKGKPFNVVFDVGTLYSNQYRDLGPTEDERDMWFQGRKRYSRWYRVTDQYEYWLDSEYR